MSVFPSYYYYYYSIILFLAFKQFYTYFSLLTKSLSPAQTHHHHPHDTFMWFFHVCVCVCVVAPPPQYQYFLGGLLLHNNNSTSSLSLSLSLSHSCQLNMFFVNLGFCNATVFKLLSVYTDKKVSVLIYRWLWIGFLGGCRCAEKRCSCQWNCWIWVCLIFIFVPPKLFWVN